jgi:hypothetical protein
MLGELLPQVAEIFRIIGDGGFGFPAFAGTTAECESTLFAKISKFNFKQPRLRVPAPPRELGF